MPPIIAALPLIASIVVAVIKVSIIIKALILVAAAVAVMLLTRKPHGNGENKLNQGQELQTKISPNLPRTILIGQTAVGPSCHFAYTTTDDSSKPNRYLYRVFQISDQPVDTLLGIWEGKNLLTFSGDITTGWFQCNQHVSKDGAPRMWARFYKGVFSGAVADSTLISASGGQWTSSHKGTGLCYAILKYDYDPDAFPNGEPELVFEVKGAHMYDDRQDSTVAGGSGTQRLSDPTTWGYTDNTAVAIAQYLRGFFINGKKIIGVGAEARDLLPAMLFSAYNTCDQSVAYSGGTEHRYVTGYNATSDQKASDALEDLMLAMDGEVFDRGGSITIWPGAVRTPVMTITEQDIDWAAQKSWQPKPSLESMTNYVSGNFIDKDTYYSEKDLPPRVNAQWELDDGGERFEHFVSMKAVNRWSQAQRVTKRIADSSRYGGTLAIVGGIWLMEMEQGDWCVANLTRYNMTNKYFKVQEITLTQDIRVALVLTEVNTSLDDWNYASDEFARTDTSWTPPGYTLPVPTFNLAGYSTFTSGTGVQDFGFTISPTSPTAGGSQATTIDVEWALTSNLTASYSVGSLAIGQASKTFAGLLPNTSYSVRARTTDKGGRHSDWSAWAALTTPAANTTTVPATIVVANPVTVYADVNGVPKSGEIEKDIGIKLQQLGANVTTGVTWSAARNTGNAAFSITGGTSPYLAITGPNDSTFALENSFTITAVYGGITYTQDIKVVKQNDPPTNTSGGTSSGSGGSGSTSSTTTLGHTTGTAYDTTNAVSAVISVVCGASGSVSLTAPISFKCLTNGVSDVAGKWQWRLAGGTFADVSTEVAEDYGADKSGAPDYLIDYGSITCNQTKTGLTSGSTYEFRFLWRETAANQHAGYVSGTMAASSS